MPCLVWEQMTSHPGINCCSTPLTTALWLVLQALNLILLTASEVRELRDLLRDARSNTAGADNFTAMYSCWSHSAGD